MILKVQLIRKLLLIIPALSACSTIVDERSITIAVSADNNDLSRQSNARWRLVWQDEFDRESIEHNKWSFEVNCYGGGNDEQQCYTDRQENAFIENGILHIVAKKELFTGPSQQDDSAEYNLKSTRTLPYTSARLRTLNKGDWQYGRFEIRAQLPQGQGTWPAIWMLPTDWVYGDWAASGEIDIMEAVNLKTVSDETGAPADTLESRIHGTLHYGQKYPDNVYTGIGYHLPNNLNPADDFHTYSVEWQKDEIRWYVDDVHYATQRSSGWYSQYQDEQGQLITGRDDAPFNQKFHLILNLAVGGNWAGNVNQTGIDGSIFPQAMKIDFVRVYQCDLTESDNTNCATVGKQATLVSGKQPNTSIGIIK